MNRRALTAALALTLTLAVAPHTNAAPPITYATPNATCARVARDLNGVLVIGDSITHAGRYDIPYRLALIGRPTCLNARSSRGTAEGLEVLRTYVRAGLAPRTVIIALGTNDSLTASAMPGLIRAVMLAAGPTRRVLWVNVYNAQSVRADVALAQTRQINTALWDADRYWQTMAVVDWYGYITPRVGYLMQPDGVHPTWGGNRARTKLMLRGLVVLRPRTTPAIQVGG